MEYQLAVLTHGRAAHLHQTIRSFLDKVKPRPARILVYSDGTPVSHIAALPQHELHVSAAQRGFCSATRRLWSLASTAAERGADDEGAPPYTFWLEHDFVFLRPVDLSELAAVLDEDKQVAQMSLMRTPVSREEIDAGGLYQMRRDDYESTFTRIDDGPLGEISIIPWMRHRAYFTTNPSLMRTDFMAWNQWPDDEPECEGRFGLDLIRRGFSFGVWGSGEPWVEHVGHRDGRGY